MHIYMHRARGPVKLGTRRLESRCRVAVQPTVERLALCGATVNVTVACRRMLADERHDRVGGAGRHPELAAEVSMS